MSDVATPAMRDWARRILTRETGAGTSPLDAALALERTMQRLYESMSQLIGATGFRSLAARALNLARSEHAWLADVELSVTSTLALGGLAEHAPRVGVDSLLAGGCALLANLLGLFGSFVGLDLTVRLVGRVWADVPFRGGSNPQEAS